jgi:hypothetical protein
MSMNSKWKERWAVPSDSQEGHYTVAVDVDGNFACGCLGWTRHMPRTDCKHIKEVRFLIKGQSSTALTMQTAVIHRMLGKNIELIK